MLGDLRWMTLDPGSVLLGVLLGVAGVFLLRKSRGSHVAGHGDMTHQAEAAKAEAQHALARRWFEASGQRQTWKGWVDDSDHQFGEAADEHCYDGDVRYPHGRDFLNLQQLSCEMASERNA